MYFRGKACSKNNSLLERVDSRAAHMEALGNGLLTATKTTTTTTTNVIILTTHSFKT